MSGTPIDPAIAKPLARYDSKQDVGALRAAIDAAGLRDGSVIGEPEVALTVARVRVADWVAILSRFKRDVDPNFDFSRKPTTKVQPPGPLGLQYMPGIPPAQVKDPATRKAYEAAIAENDRRIALFASMRELMALHEAAVDRAGASLRDAHHSLGLPVADIQAMLAAADITSADRDAVRQAVGSP